MGFRFRKSVKLAPGVKLNIGKRGASISGGVKGARVSVHSSGRTTTTVGIPGTGLSYQTQTGGTKKKSTRQSSTKKAGKSVSTQPDVSDFDFSKPSSPQYVSMLSDPAFFAYMDGYINYCQEHITEDTTESTVSSAREHLAFLREEASRREQLIKSAQVDALQKKAKSRTPSICIAVIFLLLALVNFVNKNVLLCCVFVVVAGIYALRALNAGEAADALEDLETDTAEE